MIKLKDKYDIMGYHGRVRMGKAKHKKGYMLEYSCTLIKRAVFEKIGILDPRFGRTAYYSDDDFSLRALTNGFRVGQLSRKEKPAPVIHYGAQTNTEEKAYRDMKKAHPIFLAKWKPHMDNKIVKTYVTMHTFDPWKKTWGYKEQWKKLVEKKKSKKKVEKKSKSKKKKNQR